MEPQTSIRTRADGSIDTAFYMARGRQMRSQEAIRQTTRAGRGLNKTLAGSVACLLLVVLAPVVIG